MKSKHNRKARHRASTRSKAMANKALAQYQSTKANNTQALANILAATAIPRGTSGVDPRHKPRIPKHKTLRDMGASWFRDQDVLPARVSVRVTKRNQGEVFPDAIDGTGPATESILDAINGVRERTRGRGREQFHDHCPTDPAWQLKRAKYVAPDGPSLFALCQHMAARSLVDGSNTPSRNVMANGQAVTYHGACGATRRWERVQEGKGSGLDVMHLSQKERHALPRLWC